MTDTVKGTKLPMNQIGSANITGGTCSTDVIDFKTDQLLFIKVGYNSTGVYGLEFQTFTGKVFVHGTSVTDKTLSLQTNSLTLVNATISNAFVGF